MGIINYIKTMHQKYNRNLIFNHCREQMEDEGKFVFGLCCGKDNYNEIMNMCMYCESWIDYLERCQNCAHFCLKDHEDYCKELKQRTHIFFRCIRYERKIKQK